MLSNHNNSEYWRKQQPKRQRFAVKKLTVGVASVLIGFTFMGLSASASAGQQTTPAQSETALTASQNNGQSAAANTQNGGGVWFY